jgi:hypothetical protein
MAKKKYQATALVKRVAGTDKGVQVALSEVTFSDNQVGELCGIAKGKIQCVVTIEPTEQDLGFEDEAKKKRDAD